MNAAEERRIISNAASKNRMERANTNDLQQTVMAESNLQDVATIVAQTHRNREPLLHTAVYIELSASDYDRLKLLQTEVLTELIRSKLNVDRLMLRQQQGFQSVMPSGKNVFRDQFERVLPASSVANLYPFNYSGKTDPHGFYVGRDKFGSNVLVDFNQRAEDKTNGSILILGNSGQGKSYLLKLILCNLRESGMNVICLDPEMEYEDLTNNLQGCFIDLMGGRYIINPLEPKVWDEGDGPEDQDAPETFRISSRLSQHISFLKDFFRSYKDFTDREIDVIEIMLQKLYQSRGLSDQTDFQLLEPEDYPTLSEMYEAKILRGKNKPEFTPHIDTGDYVVIVNAEKIKVTGKKLQQKIYYNHSEYVGGMRETTLAEMMQKKPEKVVELAVKGMLPKGPLGRQMITKLHVYAGPEHKHEAQKPEVLTF